MSGKSKKKGQSSSVASKAASKPAPISTLGLGLQCSAFDMTNCGYPGWSVQKIHESFVKWKIGELSLVDTWLPKADEYNMKFAPATCIIIHSWNSSYADVVDAVSQYEKQHPGTYYWFDLFCMGRKEMRESASWMTHFLDHVAPNCARMMVMSVNHLCDKSCTEEACCTCVYGPLARSWCLWETYAAIKANAPFVVVIPKSQTKRIHFHLNVFQKFLFATFSGLKFENSTCFDGNPNAKALMQVLMERDPVLNADGTAPEKMFEKFNNIVSNTISKQFLATLEADALEEKATKGLALLLVQDIGSMYTRFGQYESAMRCFTHARSVYERLFGYNNIFLASCEVGMAAALVIRGSADDLKQAIERCKRGFDLEFPQLPAEESASPRMKMRDALMNLAFAIVQHTSPDEGAGDLLARLQRCVISRLGTSSPERGDFHYHLGCAYMSRMVPVQAQHHLTQALQMRLATLPRKDCAIFEVYVSLANAHLEFENFTAAASFFQCALAACVVLVGRKTVAYGTLLVALAGVYRALRLYDRARAVLDSARALGPELLMVLPAEQIKDFQYALVHQLEMLKSSESSLS